MSMQRPEEMMAVRYQEAQHMAEQCRYSDAVARLKGPGTGRRVVAALGRSIVTLGRKMEEAGRASKHYEPQTYGILSRNRG